MSMILSSLLYNLLFLINIINHCSSTSLDTNNTVPQIGTRIVGGREATIKDHPYVVLIRKRYTSYPQCGGTYLRERWVLTAAHCLFRYHNSLRLIQPWILTVMAGSSVMSYSPTAQYSRVKLLLPHPKYTIHDMTYDIGLIKLETAFRINHYVQYVKLPSGQRDEFFESSKLCTVAGWGATQNNRNRPEYSNHLQEVQVPLISHAKCTKYPKLSRVPPDQFCAGYDDGGLDSCQGDSGGALVCDGVQYGIVSWGIGCGNKSAPGIYTRLDHYLNWVDNSVMRSRTSRRDLSSIILVFIFLFLLN